MLSLSAGSAAALSSGSRLRRPLRRDGSIGSDRHLIRASWFDKAAPVLKRVGRQGHSTPGLVLVVAAPIDLETRLPEPAHRRQ